VPPPYAVEMITDDDDYLHTLRQPLVQQQRAFCAWLFLPGFIFIRELCLAIATEACLGSTDNFFSNYYFFNYRYYFIRFLHAGLRLPSHRLSKWRAPCKNSIIAVMLFLGPC